MITKMLALGHEIGLSGMLDMLVMALIIYTLLVWSKRTQAASVLTGIVIVAGLYLAARQFNLFLTAALFERFFAVILIALVVIFQQELRYFFEQVTIWSLGRSLGKRKPVLLAREEVDVLVRTLFDLAKERIGALLVLRGKDLIVRHLHGGVDLDGKLSEGLLKSLFDPSSIGHDGAILIEGNRIKQYSAHLPLSKNLRKVGQGGTRHAAALGLTEVSDALSLVVSEERGVISAAQDGELKRISHPDQLKDILEKFYERVHPKQHPKPLEGFLKKNSREKFIALILALALWFVLVYGNKLTYQTFTIPATLRDLPADLKTEKIEPDLVYLTLSGPRNAFYFLASKEIKMHVNVPPEKGTHPIRLYPTDFEIPKNLTVEVLAPQEIEVSIVERDKSGKGADGSNQSGLLSRIKKALSSGKEEAPLPKATEDSDAEAPVPREKPDAEAKVRKVAQLQDAAPEKVVQYLEERLESKAIEALNPASSTPKNQEKA